MLSSRCTLPFADGMACLRQKRGEIGWGTVVAALFAAVVAADAGQRGMSPVGWSIGGFLLLIILLQVVRNAMRSSHLLALCVVCSIAILLVGCGGGSTPTPTPTPTRAPTPTPTPPPSIVKGWTWVSGSSRSGAHGVYGTQGVASTSNIPGARGSAVSWIDRGSNLWLFGGGLPGPSLNDLWEFSPSTKNWTWVSGSNTDFAMGNYFSPGAVPGARWGIRSKVNAIPV
jgi:hypothetical protein